MQIIHVVAIIHTGVIDIIGKTINQNLKMWNWKLVDKYKMQQLALVAIYL